MTSFTRARLRAQHVFNTQHVKGKNRVLKNRSRLFKEELRILLTKEDETWYYGWCLHNPSMEQRFHKGTWELKRK